MDERDEIRRRIHLVELVQSNGTVLKPYGKQWRGLCPFHPDKNPSFYVSGETGRYRCWACGESGDVFTWVMKTQNMDFVEALKFLATQAGVTLSSRPSGPTQAQRQSHESAMDEALAFFRDQLAKSSTAMDYCKRRGIDAETMQEWELGYAPDVGEALATHLQRKSFSLAECESLFLVQKDAHGGYFDKFRGRLMFPIRDERGLLIAFGGRIIGDGQPKYINSGDTPIFKKSRVLYGLNRAKERSSKDRRLVLCEGYLDVIACHRAGVRSAVASLGTSLTEDHAKLMKRWADEIVILYDSDAAGQKAAQKSVGILAAEGLKVKVALMPPGDDPDTLLRTKGPGAVSEAVESGLSPLDYALQAMEARLSPEEEDFWTEAIDILSESTNDMEVLKHLDRLAGMYPGTRDVKTASAILRRQIGQARKARRSLDEHDFSPRAAIAGPKTAKLLAAEVILFNALRIEGGLREAAWTVIVRGRDWMVTRPAVSLATSIAENFPDAPPSGPIGEWIHHLEPEEIRQVFSDLLEDLRAERLSDVVLDDAMNTLKKQFEERQSQPLKDSDKRRYIEQLKSLKPRYEKAVSDSNNLFE